MAEPTIDELIAKAARESRDLGSDSSMSELRNLVAELEELEDDIEAETARMKKLTRRQLELTNDLIPTSMEAVGMRSFETDSGKKIQLDDIVSGTLGQGRDESAADHEKRKAAALEWLHGNGHSGVIKRSIEIPMPRGFLDSARERICKGLRAMGVAYEITETVHPSTMKSLLNELKGDSVLPDEVVRLFRASEFKRAKVVRPRKKRS